MTTMVKYTLELLDDDTTVAATGGSGPGNREKYDALYGAMDKVFWDVPAPEEGTGESGLREQVIAEIADWWRKDWLSIDEQFGVIADKLIQLLQPAAQSSVSASVADQLRRALDAMVVVLDDGTPCYRTANSVPMRMPKRIERIVRTALTGSPREEEQ
jgi:hypothetical protein